MSWGVLEWTAIVGVVFTVISAGLASYIGVIKNNVHTSEKIESGFVKLKDIEILTQTKLAKIENRLENKGIRIAELEKMLLEYIKRHEAEAMFCKKETMSPIVSNLQKNQDLIYTDIKDFRVDFSKAISKITDGLERHIDTDMKFQKEMLIELRNIAKGK